MLITQKDILKSSPPFLMQSAKQEWLLIASITLLEASLNLVIIEKIDGCLSKRTMQLGETPFHVGADVWELNYGATLMTLHHESLLKHPAKLLWQEWINSNK